MPGPVTVTPAPPCAHRCGVVYSRDLQLARLTGQPVEVMRVSSGLTRQYVPTRTPGAFACRGCGHEYPTASEARRCADLDAGTTD